MEDKEIRIVIGDETKTLKEFFDQKEQFRRSQAGLSFEDKIKNLVKLQEIALKWGNKKDVFVWKITSKDKFKDEKLEIFVRRLNDNFSGCLKKIILFGSRARQDNTDFSDYDLLLIFDKITPQIKEKLRDIAGDMLYEYSVVFSVFAWTEEDMNRKRYSPFIMNIQREGVML